MRIIYQRADGGCAVVIPSPEALRTRTIEDIARETVPSGMPYAIVPVEAIPSERTYRQAWTLDVGTGTIRHNMPKAREIHKDLLRRRRAPLLAALDTAYLVADEKGSAGNAEKARIAGQKQVLRDMTADPAIEAAATIDALMQVWPSALGATGSL